MIRKTWLFTLEMIGVLLAVLLLAAGGLIWRLSAGPITLNELTPYMAAALSDPAGRWQTSIGNTQLVWDREAQQFRFLLQQAVTRNAAGVAVVEVPQMMLSLRLRALLLGRLMPGELYAQNVQLRLTQQADGRVWLLDTTDSSGLESNQPAANEQVAVGVLPTWREVLAQWHHQLYAIREISIKQSNLLVVGPDGTEQFRLAIEQLRATRKNDVLELQGQLATNQAAGTGQLAVAGKLAMTADATNELTVTLNNLNLGQIAQSLGLARNWPVLPDLAASGQLKIISEGAEAVTTRLQWQLQLSNGQLQVRELLPQPIQIKGGQCNGEAQWPAVIAQWGPCSFETDGPRLTSQGKLTREGERWQLQIEHGVFGLPVQRLAEFWPAAYGKNPRAWLTENLLDGQFASMTNQLVWTIAGSPLAASSTWEGPSVSGTLAMRETKLQFLAGLPPLEAVNADATYDANQFDIKISGGRLGSLQLLPSPVIISDLSGELPRIAIDATAKGDLAELLRIADLPPLSILSKNQLPREAFRGQAETRLQVAFPLLRQLAVRDVQVTVNSKLDNLSAVGFIPRIELTQGAMQASFAEQRFSLNGRASLNGLPANVELSQNFADENGGQQAKILTTLADQDWDKFGLALRHYVRGPVDAEVIYTGGAKPQLAATLNLAKAALVLDEFGWRKAAGQPASAKATVVWGQDGTIEIAPLELQGNRMRLAGKANLDDEGVLQNFELDVAELGPNQFALLFERLEGLPSITVTGERLVMPGSNFAQVNVPEAAPAPAGPATSAPTPSAPPAAAPAQKAAEPMQLTVRVAKLLTTPEKYFAPFSLAARKDTLGWQQIDLTTNSHEGPMFRLWLRPENGVSKLTASSQNFGAILRSWDALNDMQGGLLNIEGQGSAAAPRVLQGEAKLESFRVKNLPVLATLLNAVSITGLPEALAGEGLKFDRLEGDFTLEQDTLTLSRWITTGSNIGLTLDGKLDLATKQANFTGAVVPFNAINRVLSDIPLLGDLLAGGYGGGLFATNYTLTGPLSGLKTSVNPVSTITPGIFRSWFFDNRTTEDEPGKPAAGTSPNQPNIVTPSRGGM